MNRSSILSGIAVILLSLSARSVCAQTGDGFWVVESNLATPRSVTVKFYEEGNRLIYEEHLTGVRMDVSKRRTRRRLDQSLRDARALAKSTTEEGTRSAWQENKRALEDRGLVAARFGVGVAGISWSKER